MEFDGFRIKRFLLTLILVPILFGSLSRGASLSKFCRDEFGTTLSVREELDREFIAAEVEVTDYVEAEYLRENKHYKVEVLQTEHVGTSEDGTQQAFKVSVFIPSLRIRRIFLIRLYPQSYPFPIAVGIQELNEELPN